VKPGRNDPCHCGSGKKYKTCCGPLQSRSEAWAAELRRVAALITAGQFLQSEQRAAALLVQNPNSGIVWKILGLARWSQGKDALDALTKAVKYLPEDAEAHSNLGNALRAAGRIEKAVESHRRAVALKLDYAEAHNNLGSALLDLGRLDEALTSFDRAILIRPNFALAHANRGNVLTLRNRLPEAEASCRRALELEPNLTAATVQLAELQAAAGRFAEAEDLLRRAIAIEPDMPEAWSALVRWRKMSVGDAAWVAQAQRIAARPLVPGREVHLRYALGKYFDDVGDHEQAFMNFRRANELTKRRIPEHALQQFTHRIDLMIGSQTRDWLRRVCVDSNTFERPVFIVGMPRSGTTLTEQILAAHPEVFGAGELPFWSEAASNLAASRRDGADEQRTLGGLADEYSNLQRRLSPDARRVVDKMPGNFLHLGVIHAALPQARIIHMRRNPIDTCLSIYFQNFGTEHFYASDLDALALYYSDYLRLMEHWRRTLPEGTIMEVPYESLVDDTEAWSRKMLAFVGVRWDAQCLEFQHSTRAVNTFSKWQVRQKINKSSVLRWRNYEKFVEPLLRLDPAQSAAERGPARPPSAMLAPQPLN
jgi:tetratricopeptide (TPR) repeat protein